MGGTSKAWRFVRGVWLVSAVVVCFGAFLCFLPTELAVSTALTPAHSPPLDRATDDGYLAVSQEEAGRAHKDPVHADLLTMLVLAVSSFFGSERRMAAHQHSVAGGIVVLGRRWSVVGQRL